MNSKLEMNIYRLLYSYGVGLEMNVLQLLSLKKPRRHWVPLLLAMTLLQSVLTSGYPWPNQECPCQSQAEAHDENEEYLKLEALEKDRE